MSCRCFPDSDRGCACYPEGMTVVPAQPMVNRGSVAVFNKGQAEELFAGMPELIVLYGPIEAWCIKDGMAEKVTDYAGACEFFDRT